MKVYNISPELIKVADFEITGICLGEEGRGRQKTIVPAPKDGLMEPGLSKSGKPRLNPSKSAQGWIARISSVGGYIRGAQGNISVHPSCADEVRVVARGHGAFGDAGRIGTWDDLLIVGPDEFLVRVKPSRGDAYLIKFTAEKAVRLSYTEADALDVDCLNSTVSSRGDFVRL